MSLLITPADRLWAASETPSNRSESRTISGTIAQKKPVDIKDSNQKNQVILLNTAGGRRVVVDLGDHSNLKNAKLDIGQRLYITGRPVWISDRFVILAEEFRLADQVDAEFRKIDRTKERAAAEISSRREANREPASQKGPPEAQSP